MASGGQQELVWDLVKVGDVKLEYCSDYPIYSSIVVWQDKIIVTDNNACKVRLYRLHDGKSLATTERLESKPHDLCLMDEMEICILCGNGLIKMISIDSTGMSSVFKMTRSLRLQVVLDECYGVVRFKDDLIVSGKKQDSMYWCVVSLDDGYVDTIHQICKGDGWISVITKDNIIYFSCYAGFKFRDNTGVYGFDVLNPSQCIYTYKHQRLQWPTSIVINEDGNIYVCNNEFSDSSIHQLTASCQLVAIFKQGIPRGIRAIFCDNECLYVTCEGSHDIIVLHALYQARVNRTKRTATQQIEKLSSIKRKKERIPALKRPVAKKISNTSHSDVPDKAEITDIKDSKKTGVFCSDPELLCQVLKKSTQVASSSRRTLEENCQRVELKFYGETPGNGNCFFEAVSSQLQRLNCAVQKSAQQLRQDVVAFMKVNTILQVCEGTINLAEFISDDNFNDYCERMAQDGEWADHVVVVGMARMLQMDIMIVTSAPSSGPENIIAWVVGKTNFNGQPILLGHLWESHYQSLQPIDHEVHEVQQSNEGKQPVREEIATQTEQEAEPEDHSSAVPMPPPPAGDMDRFMRLTYLLVDVGSRVLRQLLSHHTVTPNCTLDQYLAKNMSTLVSLLKRKVLHQSQMDILLPPNGVNTNIEDYDVTLLSTLFNNVVPSLTQQEEGMIKRLREDRNNLYGHAKSCKMNVLEYKTCWNSISSTLISLSQQCGDPNFQAEVSQEIQRIQVSAIPTGSYLDILTTWFSTIETVKGSLETVKGSLETVKESLETTEGELRALKARVGSLELMKTADDREIK